MKREDAQRWKHMKQITKLLLAVVIAFTATACDRHRDRGDRGDRGERHHGERHHHRDRD
jgi:hypothetical protein